MSVAEQSEEGGRRVGGRVSQALSMLLVAAFSLLLLVYVGHGEAQRNYQQFVVEKLFAQGKIAQNAMEMFLRAGLPLKQYVGFSTLARPILSSDTGIAAIVVQDGNGNTVFAEGDGVLPQQVDLSSELSQIQDGSVRSADAYLLVVLPLRNKFETVGQLIVATPRQLIQQRLSSSFETLLYVAAVLSVSFAVLNAIAGHCLVGRKLPWLPLAYGVTFLIMALSVIWTLVTIYSEGAQSKTKALADSLGYRLTDIVEFNLNLNEFEGLDRTFRQYQDLNPDISAAALIINGNVLIHTDDRAVGRPWTRPDSSYQYIFDLSQPERSDNVVHVAVALPEAIVYDRVLRTVKNFAALFIASAFLAGLFLQLGSSLHRAHSSGWAGDGSSSEQLNDFALSLVKPIFFLAVFAEHLTYPFLPQFMHQVTAESGLSDGFTSALFMTYYLLFALTLIPAGQIANRRGPKPLIYRGLLLAGLGLASLTLPATPAFVELAGSSNAFGYAVVLSGRALSGIGQAMLFIGAQCYILEVVSSQNKTRGAAIIVFGFQGGMIAGTAIGSLLVGYIGTTGVFFLGTLIPALTALYAILFLPATMVRGTNGDGVTDAGRRLRQDLRHFLGSFEFLKTMLLVGIPTKAVMTGVILFALPLVLSEMSYAEEDIGQIIMLYALGVLVSSFYIPRFVDQTGRTETTLFAGMLMSALGLVLVGLSGWSAVEQMVHGTTACVIAGVLVIGLAHGFVYAPVVTHVLNTPLSAEIGTNSVTAAYRFLERIGHVAGPMIVGQLFFFAGQEAWIIAWIGVVLLVFAFLFLVRPTDRGYQRPQKETPA